MASDTGVVEQVTTAAERFGRDWAEPDPLTAVTSARQLSQAVDEALRAAVTRARTAGRTWQTIGDLLGTSRQAAFQRFGRPIDPRTGEPMTQTLVPGAAEHAVALLVDLMAGDFEKAQRDFDDTMLKVCDEAKLASTLAQVAGMVGAYEGMGEPFARTMGEMTMVDVPLRFEAGDMNGKVAYRTDGKVTGLYILRPQFT